MISSKGRSIKRNGKTYAPCAAANSCAGLLLKRTEGKDGLQLKKHDENNGFIFNIQKFSIHDGEGIRTLVFMKGCPLRCIWCCNPESQSFTEDILFVRTKCIGCGYCLVKCPQQAVSPDDFTIDRGKCTVCGTCTNFCYAEAKKKVGRWVTIRDILHELEKDRIVFGHSGGGLTVGGGEPLSQPDFVRTLVKDAHQLSFSTAMETCGHGKWTDLEGIIENLDELFMDLKNMDPERHKQLTGVDNALILENAEKSAKTGVKLTFRLPLIPGCTDDEENVAATARFVSKLEGNVRLEILPYHRLGEDKFEWMDMEYDLKGVQVHDEKVKRDMEELARSCGCQVV
jgi:pyruvate formate lyase activating enzyme